MGNFIVGIDAGSSKICGAVGKIDKLGKVQIIGITSVTCSGVKQATIVDSDAVSDAINQCIKQLENMTNVKISNVFISLPVDICDLVNNNGTVTVTSDDDIIKENDVKRVLETAKLIPVEYGREIIGIIPSQYIVDGLEKVYNPLGINGSSLEVQAKIITANTSDLNNLCDCFDKANLIIDGAVLQSVGTSEVLLTREEKSKGIVLVNVGADTTSLSIFNDGSLCFMDAIPFGGNTITNDISVCLKLNIQEAERIKTKYGNVSRVQLEDDELIRVVNSSEKVEEVKYSILSDIIAARVEEILSFVYKKLQQSGFYNDIHDVVITGGGISLFKGIIGMSEEIIGKNVKVVSPEYVGASSPLYSDCIGIIHHFKMNSNNHNTDVNYEKSAEEDFLLQEVKLDKKEKSFLAKIRKFLGDFF